jgi:uncharacterized protein (TIGR04255 family)
MGLRRCEGDFWAARTSHPSTAFKKKCNAKRLQEEIACLPDLPRLLLEEDLESDLEVTWHPIHPNHAIERTRIVVQFKDNLPQKTIERLGEAFETKRLSFGMGPRVEVQTHTLVLSPDGQTQQSQRARGWQFNRGAGTGAILEALVLDPEGLVYENVEYVCWLDFWARASEMLLPLIDGVAQISDLRLFSLEYFDRFSYVGDATHAAPVDLINNVLVQSLPRSAREGDELWHLHRGWYETIEGMRVLINQNIDANDVKNSQGDTVRQVGIFTKIERRNPNEIIEAKSLVDDIVKMHSISKDIFGAALNEGIHQRIGLHERHMS